MKTWQIQCCRGRPVACVCDIAPAHTSLHCEIRSGYTSDPFIPELKSRLANGQSDPEFAFDSSGMLYYVKSGQPRLYVPEIPELRTKLLGEAHNTPTAGHLGPTKTLEVLSRSFWWHEMSKTVHTYIRTCDACQRNKAVNQRPLGLLMPLAIPEERWGVVTMDFITGLPKTKRGSDSVVVYVDKSSKMLHFDATTTNVSAPGVARLFFDTIFRLHGIPRVIISDRDSKFTGKFWQELFRLCGTRLAMSTSFHPQTDGQTERANRTLVEMLRSFVNTSHDDWDVHLPALEFAYNNSINPSTASHPSI